MLLLFTTAQHSTALHYTALQYLASYHTVLVRIFTTHSLWSERDRGHQNHPWCRLLGTSRSSEININIDVNIGINIMEVTTKQEYHISMLRSDRWDKLVSLCIRQMCFMRIPNTAVLFWIRQYQYRIQYQYEQHQCSQRDQPLSKNLVWSSIWYFLWNMSSSLYSLASSRVTLFCWGDTWAVDITWFTVTRDFILLIWRWGVTTCTENKGGWECDRSEAEREVKKRYMISESYWGVVEVVELRWSANGKRQMQDKSSLRWRIPNTKYIGAEWDVK